MKCKDSILYISKPLIAHYIYIGSAWEHDQIGLQQREYT